MNEINLLAKLPRGKRNVNARATAKTEDHIRISREYGIGPASFADRPYWCVAQ